MNNFKLRLLKKLIYTAIGMLWLALAVGVFYREFTKFELKGVPLTNSWLPIEFIKLAHGHVLVLGFAIPIGLAVMVSMLSELNEREYNRFSTAFWLYLVGALGAIFLLIWKGIDYVRYYAHDPSITVDRIEALLFAGNKALRASLYGIFHLTFGVGLLWFTVLFLKVFGKQGG